MTLVVGRLWAGHQPHGASLQQHEDKTHPSQRPGETEQTEFQHQAYRVHFPDSRPPVAAKHWERKSLWDQLSVLTAEDSKSVEMSFSFHLCPFPFRSTVETTGVKTKVQPALRSHGLNIHGFKQPQKTLGEKITIRTEHSDTAFSCLLTPYLQYPKPSPRYLLCLPHCKPPREG